MWKVWWWVCGSVLVKLELCGSIFGLLRCSEFLVMLFVNSNSFVLNICYLLGGLWDFCWDV